MSVGSKTVIAVRSAAAVVAAAGVAGTSAQQAGVWDDPPTALLWACILSPGFVAVGEQVRAIMKERKAGGRAVRTQAFEVALNEAVLEIAEITEYSPRYIGISVWRVRKASRLTEKPARLQRLARRRATQRPSPSDIEWTRGKGVIGRCWERQDEVYRDLRKACRKYPDGEVTDARWPEVSDDLKMDMNLKEFRMMIGKYGEVLAVPIKSESGTFLGCVAVDVPIEAYNTQDVSKLGHVNVRRVVTATAAFMREVIEGA